MDFWEFLLQQEGDSAWLPLDTSQMEILEGRYRIMAHCSQPETPVQIHISQMLTDRVPPKRRSLGRQGYTNENGLLVVLPFTRLTTGTWDIYCQGLTSEVEMTASKEAATDESPWCYAIQLRVLAQGVGEDGDWFADDGANQGLSTVGSGAAAADLQSSTVDAAPPSSKPQPAEATPMVWSRLDPLRVSEAIDQAQANLASADVSAEPFYHLTLAQTAFMAAQGHPIQLSGQISSVVEGESCLDMALVVRLSDPQTAEVLDLTPVRLRSKAFPADFSVELSLPDSMSTRLVLGELALVSQQADTITLLALKRFTVTVDLAALFDEIANRAEENPDSELIFAPDRLAEGDRADSLSSSQGQKLPDLAGLDFPVAPPRSVPNVTLPRSNSTIPPKIYYPSPHEVSVRKPVLPPLGHPKPSPSATDIPQDGEPESQQFVRGSVPPTPEDVSPSPHGKDAEGQEPGPSPADEPVSVPKTAPSGLTLPPLNTQPPQAESVPESSTAAEGGQGSENVTGQSTGTEPPMLPSHEVMAFKALNLQERFWSRLNDLAVTIQEESQSARESDVEAYPPTTADEVDSDEPVFIPFEGEVVIYEDPGAADRALSPEQATTLVNRLQQDEEVEPVTPPVPDIEIGSTDLVAGDTILLTLRVPYHPNRLYLRVWITDPQTRSLTDEPRQITHLAPNGLGQLEGSMQLTVPMGCLEVRLEAIAVDMVTQQESYKASIPCSVNPLGAEASDLDEFEL